MVLGQMKTLSGQLITDELIRSLSKAIDPLEIHLTLQALSTM